MICHILPLIVVVLLCHVRPHARTIPSYLSCWLGLTNSDRDILQNDDVPRYSYNKLMVVLHRW